MTPLTLSSAAKATLFGIISWRCLAPSEHGIARPRTWHALGGFRQCGTESQQNDALARSASAIHSTADQGSVVTLVSLLTRSGPTAAFFCRCAKVVDGGVGRRVEPEDRSGACDAALSLQCAILIHVEWRIFPEYVGGGDQFMLRRRARWQRLAGKQPQCERQHVVAVAVWVDRDQ